MTMRLNEAWLARLRQRLDAPPLQPRAPLAIAVGGAVPVAIIGSIEATLALELAGAGLPLRDAGDAWQIEVPASANATQAIDAALAAIARWLHDNGRVGKWRDELLAVTDAAGTPIGSVERAVVRPLGIATLAVHLVVCDARGDVWVQQRALDKATDPGQWDTTVGGLIAAGETVAQTLVRETWEEAGLRIDALQRVAPFGRFTERRPLAEGYMVEHIEMFEALAPDGLTPVNQDGEVAQFERLDRATLVEWLHADAFTLEAAMILAEWLAL
jgi:8-oxo-dGTP pyrophosphatase MutT (NUDIX family)